jgi:hypothetical protein
MCGARVVAEKPELSAAEVELAPVELLDAAPMPLERVDPEVPDELVDPTGP